MEKYTVKYNGKTYRCSAESAVEAIQKVSRRMVFGRCLICNPSISLVDADTRGDLWAEAIENTDNGRRRIFAELEKQ